MEQRYGFGYRLATVANPFDGKALPVSRGAVSGPTHNYVTIPWNATDDSPDDPFNTVSMNNGWTFLFGPIREAIVIAHVRLQVLEATCSTHLRLYKVNGAEQRVWGSESPEHFVGDRETHVAADGTVSYSSTHCHATWRVPAIAEGEKLRLEVDYWNATDPRFLTGRISGARVEGIYWRDVN